MTEREALKLALEALELNEKCSQSMDIQICADASQKTFHAITAIKEALAQPAQQEGCQCPACQVLPHASDCAVHNGPAYPKGKCDCGVQQEPVAWIYSQGKAKIVSMNRVPGVRATPLYTTPPQRTWVGLTDEEQQAAYAAWQQKDDGWGSFYALIEAKLKEKNT